jgi:hypothetical protein
MACVGLGGLSAPPLQVFKRARRVLVVSAPSAEDPSFRRQDRWLARDAAGLRERDMVVIEIVADAIASPREPRLHANAVRGAIGLDASRFGVALIGKDGSEAFRASRPVTATALFAIIDAMPRRRGIELRGHRWSAPIGRAAVSCLRHSG